MIDTFIKCKYYTRIQTITEKLIQTGWVGRTVTQPQLARMFNGTQQRLYNLVNRALGSGELLQLRRGLYLLAQQPNSNLSHPFVLAQALQPGSYVSFETALSFHGWIPESVPVTRSVSPGRRSLKIDLGNLGLYQFSPLALRPGFFLQAVTRHSLSGQVALVAQPLRALLDIVCFRKLQADHVHEFSRSMRIDDELFMRTTAATWRDVRKIYTHKRMISHIQALKLGVAS